ncbi:MAG TPA: hypothetical protein VJ964_10955 [Balneolaceae bacterium]|nr:hypothetical protein [Balneolaceae bacterium]
MGSYKQHRSRKPIDLDTLRLRMTDVFKKLERIIMDPDYDANDVSNTINAVNALSGLANRYARLHKDIELTERIEKLEKLAEQRNR